MDTKCAVVGTSHFLRILLSHFYNHHSFVCELTYLKLIWPFELSGILALPITHSSEKSIFKMEQNHKFAHLIIYKS